MRKTDSYQSAGWIVLAGLVMGLGFGFFFLRANPASCGDVDGFGQLGATFAEHGHLAGSIRRGPIYPVFLGLLYAGFGKGNHAAVIGGQTLLLILLGLSARRISQALFVSERAAFWTGMAVVLHPLSWWYVPRLWVELCDALFVLWMVFAAIRAVEQPTWRRLAGFGLLAGLSSLCKATTLLYPPFLAAGVGVGALVRGRAFAHLGVQDWLKFALVPLVVMALTIAPWTARNWKVSGRWVPVSSNLGVEFFRGTVFADHNSHLLRRTIPEIWAVAMQREAAVLQAHGYPEGAQPDWAEKDDVFDPLMKDYVRHSPAAFAVKIAKQIPAFWIRGETRGKSLVFMACALGTLGLWGWSSWCRRSFSATGVVLWTVLYFNLLYAAVLAWARYSMPLYPLLLLVGIPGAMEALERMRANRRQVSIFLE